MRRSVVISLFLLLSVWAAVSGMPASGVVQARDSLDISWTRSIDRVVVVSRPAGVVPGGGHRTRLDTTILHESISSSLADIIAQNSTVFIKSYGRATLATASFRGTSPAHTQVAWNGMRINSPMLGMVDFSLIPAYFIDDAQLLHGTSSVGVAGGGLGGAITLSTRPAPWDGGFGMQYIQGVGSFSTFDRFLRITAGGKRWQTSTRTAYSTSRNDFRYRNYNKIANPVLGDDYTLVSWEHPVERNRNGAFRDFHLLQEAYFRGKRDGRFGLAAWYVNSLRGVPMLNVDYRDGDYRNEQREETFRGTVSWNCPHRGDVNVSARAGYTYTDLGYNYMRDLGNGTMLEMIRSITYAHTAFGTVEANYYPLGSGHESHNLALNANIAAYQHFIVSRDMSVMDVTGNFAGAGYDKARAEFSASLSARWNHTPTGLGFALVMREDVFGGKFSPPIPAFFAEWTPFRTEDHSLTAKASVSRNYRFPTLNDLYFLPGGRSDLKPERGFTYDAGFECRVRHNPSRLLFKADVSGFDSYIDDWIVWLPSFKGFWEPRNVRRVHSYGIEGKVSLLWNEGGDCRVSLDGNYAWTPSINMGDPLEWHDNSIGKQLVYIPLHSASLTGRVGWRSWTFSYKWGWYSERFTTSSNETSTRIGLLPAYFMSDVSLEKNFSFPWAFLSIKGVINNLFNEEYESVLHRPMPRMNYEFFLEIRPAFRRR